MNKPYTVSFLSPEGRLLVIEYVDVLVKSQTSKVYRCEIEEDDDFILTYFSDLKQFNEMIIKGEEVKYFVIRGKKRCECYIEKYKKSYIMELVDMRHFYYLKNEDMNKIKINCEETIKKLEEKNDELIEYIDDIEEHFQEKYNNLKEKYNKKRSRNEELKERIAYLEEIINSQKKRNHTDEKYHGKKYKKI